MSICGWFGNGLWSITRCKDEEIVVLGGGDYVEAEGEDTGIEVTGEGEGTTVSCD